MPALLSQWAQASNRPTASEQPTFSRCSSDVSHCVRKDMYSYGHCSYAWFADQTA
jgi:hypothetical protein